MNKALQSVYNYSPSFLQNVLVSAYGLKLYFREYGRSFRRLSDEFEKMQWYSRDELESYQSEKLKVLIEHCYNYVPYYRNIMDQRKLKPADISSTKDLYKMPILTREDIIENFTNLISKNIKGSRLILGYTSGTTGSPLQFYWDRGICLIKNVIDWRQKRDAGIKVGDKLGMFLGRVIVPLSRKTPPFWRLNRVLNHMFFSSFHLSAENMEYYVTRLKQFGPAALECYPSTAYIVARFVLNKKVDIPLKAVFTTSETLLPYQRETIEKAFRCRVFDSFGMAERVVFATECREHNGLHLNMDFGITEILKNGDVAARPGELGRIVATGLHNYAMPLIRYKTSDIGFIRDETCNCRRKFPLLGDITSRTEDIISTKDGRYISPIVLQHPFKPMKTVKESQIIQEDIENIRIKIVKNPNYCEDDTRYLLTEMKNRIGANMKIEIEFVDSIPRTRAGKYRWVISKVPLEF